MRVKEDPDSSLGKNIGSGSNPAYSKPGRIKRVINRVREAFTGRKNPWLMMIINPAAGQLSPDLRLFNRLVKEAGLHWKVEITNAFGDGERLAREAVYRGACTVVVFGGDGTIMDAAMGLRGSSVPLGILPGGTGNALAKELLIPSDIKAAFELILSRDNMRRIDLGLINERAFLLRLGVGLEAEITRTADRELKDRLGLFAYPTATLQALGQAKIAKYVLEIDGKIEHIEGLACMVANAATLGIPGLNISPKVRIDDGLLDVIMIRSADLNEIATLAASVIGTPQLATNQLAHWQCKELVIRTDPSQQVEADGEELGSTPIKVRILPGAFSVIAPKIV